MQLSEEQADEIKTWVVKRLEDISDADSDVLADYVLALIRTDAPDEEIRKASVENLEDFLREHTAQFVDELFATFGPKQQLPSPPKPLLSQDIQPPAAESRQPLSFNPSAALLDNPYSLSTTGAQQQDTLDGANYGRKRSFHEGFQVDQEREDAPYSRPLKTQRRRRGSSSGKGDWMGRDVRAPVQYPPPIHGFPMMPPVFPPFNQNDPMGSMMALQAMGFPQIPGMPPMPIPPGLQSDKIAESGERCPFYETQGICYLGSACPYQHGSEVTGAIKDDEYDPKTSNIVMDIQKRGDGYMRGSDRGRGRGRGDRIGFGPRGRRSEFSAVGPNEDMTVTTIVVEQIPEDKLEEAIVRDFFSQYGEILDISVQSHKRLATITYSTHASAKRAWSSPKVIFDNRFVKVYWHKKTEKNDDHPTLGGPHGESSTFNREEFERQQQEAQKIYDEKKKKRQETEEARQALDRQREELLMKQREEKDRLLQKISAAGKANGKAEGADAAVVVDSANEQTRQLRAKLASLEEEAKSLGIDTSGVETGYSARGCGRGFYRGRGGYMSRGRGYDSSYHSRGAFRGRGGVLRLDNRPKRVAVSGVEFNSEKDEALRQFLVGVGEYESISPNPDDNSSVVVAFKERYQAEKFMFGPWTIPSIGEVQLSWMPNLPAPAKAKASPDEDVTMESATTPQPSDQPSARKEGNEVDYDVAEMDDSWGVP